ncbi:MAG: sulfotransferase [Gemmatimonadota bacterium]
MSGSLPTDESAAAGAAAPFAIITGMHRSNTSLLARVLNHAGLAVGDQLIGANEFNPYGHYEDDPIARWHKEVLARRGLGWRVLTDPRIRVDPEEFQGAVRYVEARRARASGPWGFKVPHAVLALDAWARFPEARFAFIFRHPREVIGSLLRRAGIQLYYKPYYPGQAMRTYVVYNRLIRDFRRAHPARSYLIDNRDLLVDPAGVVAHLSERLGLGALSLREGGLVDRGLTGRTHGGLPELVAAGLSRARAPKVVYRELVALSDSAGR